MVKKYYTSPATVGAIPDADARYYTIMRLALPRDVGWIATASPATPLKLAKAGVAHAERLIRDVRDGTLTPPGGMPETVRRDLSARLRPDKTAARRLDAVIHREGELLPKHCWNLAFLANWTGGTLGLHLHDFPHYFGDTPIRDIGLLATEGRMSIPMEDGSAQGVLDVTSNFFEFIDDDIETPGNSDAIRCHEVTPGRVYRIIMTNSAGFYRYDIGDRVLVHGFMGTAPLIEFLDRGSRVSSITGEKVTEWQVVRAFDLARTDRIAAATDFLVAPHWADPPHYQMGVECESVDAPALAERFDRELRALNLEYASKRKTDRLGPVVVIPLAAGALQAVL